MNPFELNENNNDEINDDIFGNVEASIELDNNSKIEETKKENNTTKSTIHNKTPSLLPKKKNKVWFDSKVNYE